MFLLHFDSPDSLRKWKKKKKKEKNGELIILEAAVDQAGLTEQDTFQGRGHLVNGVGGF